jgi:hypothetical protein
MGSKVTRWLYAACLDRMLISQGKKQKFGTQYQLNSKTGRYVHFPTDTSITDKERRKYGVQPLSRRKNKEWH